MRSVCGAIRTGHRDVVQQKFSPGDRSHISACTRLVANSALPTPRGPAKRYACDGRLRNSASSRPAISRCPRIDASGMAIPSSAREHLVHGALDVGGDGGNWTVGVDHDDARWLGLCDREKTVAHLAMEFRALALEPIRSASGPLRPRASTL